MASRQEKEQRKETNASVLIDVKRRDQEWDRHEERPGVIGSVIKAVQSAKEAVVGKTNDEHGTRNVDVEETTESAARSLDEKAREMKERDRERILEMKENAKDAAIETKGYVAEKVREASERTKQMAESAKGKTKDTEQSATEKTKEKTLETSQLAADKTKDTAQSAAGKLGELKDKAMGLFSGKKEESKERMYESNETAKEKPTEVQEEARLREKKMGLTTDKYEGDLAGRVLDDNDEGKEDRGRRILGALGALKEKLTLHMSNSDKTHRSTDVSSVAGRNEGEKKAQRTSEEKVAEVYMGDTSPGAIASTLKASDQMTGQMFNEVGRIDDEGVRIVRRDLQGKM